MLLLLRGAASSQWEGLAILTTQRRDQLAQECVVELAAGELGEQQATSTQPKASTVLLTIPPYIPHSYKTTHHQYGTVIPEEEEEEEPVLYIVILMN